jgi:hypothetical protein
MPGDRMNLKQSSVKKRSSRMIKGLSISALVVALAACTAVATMPGQIQSFNLGLLNGAFTAGGDTAVLNTNLGVLDLSQLSTDNVRHTTAFQGFNGVINQVAGAGGIDGAFGAGQVGGLYGTQYQNPTTGVQTQLIGGGLAQNVDQAAGAGSVLGIQTAVGIGVQVIFTPYGATANVQALADVLYGASAGGPGGATTINSGGSIQAGQTSMPWW